MSSYQTVMAHGAHARFNIAKTMSSFLARLSMLFVGSAVVPPPDEALAAHASKGYPGGGASGALVRAEAARHLLR